MVLAPLGRGPNLYATKLSVKTLSKALGESNPNMLDHRPCASAQTPQAIFLFEAKMTVIWPR